MRSLLLLLMLITSSLSEDEVVITSFPSEGYILRNEPFLLSCTVINAISIRFRCNDRWMDESSQLSMEGTNEGTGIRYLQSSINISKEERCDCYGVGHGDRTVKSEKEAVISHAFMRKHFEQTPSSLRIKEGSQIALPCVPPLAHPLPTIQWTRNGEVITLDNYRIMASDGSLLLSSARLQDAGTYVCSATNVAGSRSTPPASIHVYVDGRWSEWTEWSGQCSVDCHQLSALIKLRGHEAIPTLSRRRWCNNPPPLNGGLSCAGDDEESSPCPHSCSVDGGWSEWSKWSECSSQCSTKRERFCSQPYPLNGGRNCTGDSVDSIPCATGVCSTQWSISDGIVLVSLAAVFFLLSILISLCCLLLWRQKNSQSYYGDIVSYKSGVIPESRPFLHSPLPSMTMTSNNREYARCESGTYSMSRGGDSRQALLDGSSTSSTARKAYLTTASLSEDDIYATVYDCVGGKMIEGDCILPAKVDRDGGRLSMDKNRTSLLIGEGSFDSPTLVILSVNSPLDDLPMLDEGEIPVSSLISVSSSSMTVIPRFPFILSFTHSIQSVDEWTISLYCQSNNGWDRFAVDSDVLSPSSIYPHFDPLTPSLLHCIIPHGGKFILCARPKKMHPMLRMRVAVFTRIERTDSFPLRVSIVPECTGLMDHEDIGQLVAETCMDVMMEGGPISMCIEDMPSSFSSSHNYKEIDLSTQSSHTFHIKSINHIESFCARLVLLQKGQSSSPCIVSLSLDNHYDQLGVTEDAQVSLDFHLPHSMKLRISSLLDPPSERDWVSLARALGASSFVDFGRALASPTTVLLTLWEARREDPNHLSHALRLSGRPEIAQMIDKFVR